MWFLYVAWNYFYVIKIIFDGFEIFVQVYKAFISYFFLISIQNESLKMHEFKKHMLKME